MVAAIVAVLIIGQDHQIWKALKAEDNDSPSDKIILPSLTDSKIQWSRFNFPNFKLGLAILLGTMAFYQFFDGLLFITLGQVDPRPSFGEVVAISVAATAILFPLFGLIIGYNSSEGPGIFTNPEVLLRHAFAFPMSLILVSLVGNVVFETHYYWAQVIAVLTLLIAAFVLFRLLEALFVPKAWNDTERRLIRLTVNGATREIAALRAGTNLTFKNIKRFDPYVSNLYSIRVGESNSRITVSANRLGVVEEIDDKKLEELIDDLKLSFSNVTGELTPEGVSAESVSGGSNSRPDFQIVLRANPGNEILEIDREIAVIHFSDEKEWSDDKKKEFKERLLACFTIAAVGDRFQNRDVLDRLLERLRQTGRSAIRDSNLSAIKKLAETYQDLTKALIKTFRELGIYYSRKDAKNEIPFFGNDWMPLTEMLAGLNDFQELVLSPDVKDRRIRQDVLYIPFSLAAIAYRDKEHMIFSNLLNFASTQNYWIRTNQIKDLISFPREWVKSLLDHSIRFDLETDVSRSSKESFALEASRTIFEVLLYLGKSAIDWADKNELQEIYETLNTYPELFQFEDTESELAMEESIRDRVGNSASTNELDVRIKKLKTKAELKGIFRDWRQEVAIGLGSYALLQIDGKGSEKLHGPPNSLYPIIEFILSRSSQDLQQIVQLHIRMNKLEYSARWGWEFWEKIPTRFAKALESPEYQKHFMAILFLRAAQDLVDNYGIESWKLDDIQYLDTHDFSDNPGTLRAALRTMQVQAANFGVNPTEVQTNTLNRIFDEIRTKAKLNSDLKLARADLMQEKIEKAKIAFDEKFSERSTLRKIFELIVNPTDKIPPESGWGIFLLVAREFFAETEVHYPEAGKHYGEGIGPSEDEYLFKDLALNGSKTENETISSLISNLRLAGCDLSDIAVLVSRAPYSMKMLRSDGNYRINNKPRTDENTARPEGFYSFEGTDIPVFQIFLRSDKSRHSIIVCNRKTVAVEQLKEAGKTYLPKSGFSFEIRDPKTDRELAQRLIAGDYDYLKDVSAAQKNELVAKLVSLEILEKIQLSIRNPAQVLVQSLDTKAES